MPLQVYGRDQLGGHAGVAPEVNLREHTTCISPPSVNKAADSGFETQRLHHQKYKTGVSVAPQKGLMSYKNFKKTSSNGNMIGGSAGRLKESNFKSAQVQLPTNITSFYR